MDINWIIPAYYIPFFMFEKFCASFKCDGSINQYTVVRHIGIN